MQAETLAEVSAKSLVTAAQLQALGAHWERGRAAWVFPDGSAGAFMKTKPVMKAGPRFSHYRFGVVTEHPE